MQRTRSALTWLLGAIIAALGATATQGASTGPHSAADTLDVPSEGLWEAKRRFGPDVRGTLRITRSPSGWRAAIAGHSVAAQVASHVAGDSLRFTLPNGAGAFSGRFSRDRSRLAGHWVQPRTTANGTPYASPLVLRLERADRWVGVVVPLDDELTLFLRLTRGPDGTLTGFLRNPERNLGRQLRVSRIERVGSEVRLLGHRNGRGAEMVLARGMVNGDGFSLHFPGRGGSYDFRRVREGEHTHFYPRGHQPATYSYQPPPALADGWPVGTPESVGLSRDTLSALVRRVINQSMDSLGAQQVHAVLIARHRRLVLEEYFHGEHRDKPHDTRSAAKSITATLAGATIRQGALALSSPVYAIMHDGRLPADIEPRKRTITLEHFLGMSSGIDCDDRDPNSPGGEDTILDQAEEPDYYRLAMRLRTVREPGEQAVYCSIQPHLVGGVVARATRRALADVFHDLLAAPLGIERYYLNLSPSGDPYMGGGIRLTARDFARFGQLYLNGGMWKGQRILDAAFVRRASEPRFALGGIRYGFYWWVIDYPFRGGTVQAYFAGGNGGQLVMVIPTLDMVVATFGANYSDPVLFNLQRRYVPDYILPAVKD